MKELQEKAEKYCAYTERCSHDVRCKLQKLGADESTISKIIAKLQKDDYLDDARFANAFAYGKFKNNRWGKTKIRAGLMKRQVSELHINKALEVIDDESYRQCLLFLINKKTKELEGKPPDKLREKVVAYCLQKGFEADLVWKIIIGNA